MVGLGTSNDDKTVIQLQFAVEGLSDRSRQKKTRLDDLDALGINADFLLDRQMWRKVLHRRAGTTDSKKISNK